MNSETGIQTLIALAVSKTGARVFRNQVGEYRLADGRYLVSGLCPGSSDLVGFTNHGLFLAIEVKRPGKQPTAAQSNFIKAVIEAGGVAFSASSPEDAVRILTSWPTPQ